MTMKINEAKKLIMTLLRLAREKRVYNAIEIIGGPGMGKSEIVFQAVEELNKAWGGTPEKRVVGCKPFFLTTVEPPDVRGFGLPSKDANGKMVMTFTAPPW